jgi:hypothetical protein
MSDDELPGMWEHADFLGGWSDTCHLPSCPWSQPLPPADDTEKTCEACTCGAA